MKQTDAINYKVTKCPLAEFATKNNIETYGKIFFCDNYELIATTFNQEIVFERVSNMMDGDCICEFCFSHKKS